MLHAVFYISSLLRKKIERRKRLELTSSTGIHQTKRTIECIWRAWTANAVTDPFLNESSSSSSLSYSDPTPMARQVFVHQITLSYVISIITPFLIKSPFMQSIYIFLGLPLPVYICTLIINILIVTWNSSLLTIFTLVPTIKSIVQYRQKI